MENRSSPKIAVIGMGPRGLGALESLAALAQNSDTPLMVDVFDPFTASGAGPNFDPSESDVCWLNIPMRDIEIRPPDLTRIGSFADWHSASPDPNTFPTRADLGRYLTARYADLKSLGVLSINHISKWVEHVRHDGFGWHIGVEGGWHGPYAEVLLALGQPEVTPDDQLAGWQRHADQSAGVLAQAYPARNLVVHAQDWAGRAVAIRGMALSAFDVLRVLTTAQGGRFEHGNYMRSGREPARILPFSLNGQPPFPKPETKELDARFAPEEQETSAFAASIAEASATTRKHAQELINAALVPVVTRLLQEMGTQIDAQTVADWLDDEWASPGSQETGGPYEILREGIEMAEGSRQPSIGYTVGQVWRKWQDELRSGYNPAVTPRETANAIVGFDEGLKRYSYGPPISSSRELTALIEAEIVDLSFATDPEIELTDDGWKLKTSGASAEVSVVIDAVLPSPDLQSVVASLVSQLLADGRIRSFSDGLAADTAEDGSLIGEDGNPVRGLCLLGRLALGSVVAADSLHDCFGEASHRWAKGVMNRIG